MIRHPSRDQLLAYAESLVDRDAPVSAGLAAHVSSCAKCKAEVAGIRASLDFTASADALEPSRNLTASILMAAQQEQTGRRRPRRIPYVPVRALQVVLGAALLIALAVIWYPYVLGGLAAGGDASAADSGFRTANDPAPEVQQKTNAEIRALKEAVAVIPDSGRNLREESRRRAAESAVQDIEMARDALRRNPGNARAHIVAASASGELLQTLRRLYLEQPIPARHTDSEEARVDKPLNH